MLLLPLWVTRLPEVPMFATSLATVLQTLSVTEKLDYLRRLHPGDAAAITILIDDCLLHRWPKTAEGWHAIMDRLADRAH